MQPSRVRSERQGKACDTQYHHQTEYPWECVYAFHGSILLCLWWTVPFDATYVLLALVWLAIISLLTTYLRS
jgi:hypothetical protein